MIRTALALLAIASLAAASSPARAEAAAGTSAAPSLGDTGQAPPLRSGELPAADDGNVLVDLAVVPTEMVRYDVNGQELPGAFLLGTWANLATRSFSDSRVRMVSSFRFDLDTAVTAKEQAAFQPYLQPTSYSLFSAYLEAELPHGVQMRLGRQFHADAADYLAFDGANIDWDIPATPLTLELYGGVRTTFAIATGQLASSLYQLDGVQQESSDQPLVGTVLRWKGSLVHRAQASLGFRWSGRTPGDPTLPDQINTTAEELVASAGGDLGPVHLWGAAAYEVVLEALMQAQAAATVDLASLFGHWVPEKLLAGDTVSLQYRRYRPVFALDSIFNYFSIYPYDEYALALDGWAFGGLRLDLRGFSRWFFSDTTDRGGNPLTIAPGPESANGGQLSGVWSSGPLLVDAVGELETGALGTRFLLDGGVRRSLGEAFELFGRLSLSRFALAQQPTQEGMSYGAAAGATWHLPAHANVSLVLQETVNPFATAVPSLFAVADLARWL